MNYKKYLLDEILPVWMNITPDIQNGGVFTAFDEKHQPIGSEKSVWFLGRALWVYAMAYMHCDARNI